MDLSSLFIALVIAKEEAVLAKLEKTHQSRKVIPVTVTSYCSYKNECEGDPFVTATGYKLKKSDKRLVVAVSRDLFKKLRNKKIKLKIEGKIHHVVVKDTMHPRWKNRVDLYYHTDKKGAFKFGKKKGHILKAI